MSRNMSSAALLVGLLFGFVVVISYQVNRADTLTAVEGTIQTVVSPAHRLVSGLWIGVSSGWSDYVGLIGQASEADGLREHVAYLERRIMTFEETSRENARLKQLLSLQSRIEIPSIPAQTIGRDTAHGYESFTVNRGSLDGVTIDSAVLSPAGVVVGRIVVVTPWTSTLQLITDPQSAVGAKIVRTSAHGVIHGTGGAILELDYVTSLADVEAGDIVVTSGDDGIYPPGLEIGRVARVLQGAPVPGLPRLPLARTETALFLDIDVGPLVDVLRVGHVLLLAPAAARE